MKKIVVLLVFAFISISKIVGQDEKFRAAENLFSHGYYSLAAPLYSDLLKKDSTDVYLHLKAGLCFLDSRSQKFKAAFYLQHSVMSNGTLNPNLPDSLIKGFVHLFGLNTPNRQVTPEDLKTIAYRFLGDAYYYINQFDRAIACYDKVKSAFPDKQGHSLLLADLNENIELCLFGKQLTAMNGAALKLKAAKLPPDRNKNNVTELAFNNTLNRTIAQDLKNKSFNLELKSIYPDYSIQQVSNKSCSSKNTGSMYVKGNETTVGTSTDGQLVLVYRVNPEGQGNLYTTRLIDNEWTNPERLDKIVNNKGWETGEFVSVDGSVMYFTSDKPGGFGGKDIYCSKRQKDGSWGKEENLGPEINTRFDEDAPFIYPNGTTLYFRSNGHLASGCFDIFISSLTDTGWSQAINVGYPVDMLPNEKVGADYLSPSSQVVDQQNTNYLATFYNLDKIPLTLVKRQILDPKNKPVENVKITITSRDGNAAAVYNSNRSTGNYLFVLPANVETYVHYEADGYFFQSELIDFSRIQSQYQTFKPVQLKPFSGESTLELNALSFDNTRLVSTPVTMAELDHLADFLKENSAFNANVISYVASGNKGGLNKKLAREHSQAIADYLVSKGIAKERLNCKGYGKIKQKQGSKNTTVSQRYEIKLLKDSSKKV
jgi:outer membrane protein OmpA-like peptidoglycan-associated protein